MSLIRRLLRAFGFVRLPRLAFDLQQEIDLDLQRIAAQEHRAAEEVAAELLSMAIARRRQAEERLQRWHALSPRQQHVVALTCLGLTNRQIAARLGVSPETVKSHLRNALRKFGLQRKLELRSTLADWDFSDWDDFVG